MTTTEEVERYKVALERIRNYKSDKGDSYDDLLMVMAIADDALEPKVLVTSNVFRGAAAPDVF